MENENQNHINWYETLTFKMALLGIMAIMFLVPLQLIKNVINERAENSQSVQQQISEEWGKVQTITGPVLNIPVTRTIYNEDNRVSYASSTWHILAEDLDIKGRVLPQTRYKGIYETVIYESDLKISGSFVIPGNIDENEVDVKWNEAYFTLGISDNRGIIRDLALNIENDTYKAQPGCLDHDLFSSGVTFPCPLKPENDRLGFNMDLGLRGSSGIYFSPVGKSTSVHIESTWTSPSFTGNYLPENRTTGEDGFDASWNITHLNRNFPQSWYGAIHRPEDESFGVDLILEVDHYRKSERSAKYGLLFIAFTYLVLLFLELSSTRRIHLFHYFLVSLALVLFFSLLNSLSEHIGFSPAYLISSAATIGLLTVFTGSLLKKSRHAIIVGGMLTALYVFIYILLALNEFAYLAGNIGLFIALAAIMWLSAKTNLFRKSGI